jgi:hypothetical protein
MLRCRLRRKNQIDRVQADQDYMGLCVCVGFQSLIFIGLTYFKQKIHRILEYIVLKTNLMSVNQLAFFAA